MNKSGLKELSEWLNKRYIAPNKTGLLWAIFDKIQELLEKEKESNIIAVMIGPMERKVIIKTDKGSATVATLVSGGKLVFIPDTK